MYRRVISIFDKTFNLWYINSALKEKSIQNSYSSELGIVRTNNNIWRKNTPEQTTEKKFLVD